MDVFFAALAFAAAVGGIGFGLSAGRYESPRLSARALRFAAAVAATAMLGSLYYSEIRRYVPCELCWYQRVAMYSLAIILLLAVVRADRRVAPYAMALSLIGFGVSAYHYYVQRFAAGSSCGLDATCAVQWVDVFGFISIPLMAGAGFLGVAGSMLCLLKVRAS